MALFHGYTINDEWEPVAECSGAHAFLVPQGTPYERDASENWTGDELKRLEEWRSAHMRDIRTKIWAAPHIENQGAGNHYGDRFTIFWVSPTSTSELPTGWYFTLDKASSLVVGPYSSSETAIHGVQSFWDNE